MYFEFQEKKELQQFCGWQWSSSRTKHVFDNSLKPKASSQWIVVIKLKKKPCWIDPTLNCNKK